MGRTVVEPAQVTLLLALTVIVVRVKIATSNNSLFFIFTSYSVIVLLKRHLS